MAVMNQISIFEKKSFQKSLVRKGGFEPPRLTAPPPQDGVSASSTTSALARMTPSGRENCIQTIDYNKPSPLIGGCDGLDLGRLKAKLRGYQFGIYPFPLLLSD